MSMPKINQEEYEMLKDLDDSLKWIVRSRYGWLFATRTTPIKIGLNWEYGGIGAHLFTDKESETLGFIKWTDDEPYEIAELIREYEYTADYYAGQFAKLSEAIHGNESEETEVKSKKDLVNKWESAIEAAEFYGKGKEDKLISYMKGFIYDLNQLDEPETLSQELLDNRSVTADMIKEFADDETKFVQVDRIKDLLVPKQEGQEPETVASVMADFYKSLERLKEVLGMEVEELEE